MSVVVVMQGPSGETVALGHGALIGRLGSADLHVSDPRVSEAHAMVSLRGRDVHLLALRGRLGWRGRWGTDVVLEPGQTLGLAPGVEISVLDVRVPDEVLAIEGDGVPRVVLVGVTSLYGGARPRIVVGWQPDADDHLWPDGDGWVRGLGRPRAVGAGDAWDVGGVRFRAVAQVAEGAQPTLHDPAIAAPMRIVARWDTVHLQRVGAPTVVLTGHVAKVISELVTTGTALPWEALARMRWPDADRDLLRHRWDMHLRRLRLKLAAHRLRTDLLRADGSGLVELVLAHGDTVVDET